MTIGLPRAMLYYRYKALWETFFTELGCDVVVSRETDKKILEDGIGFSIDENCLPSKIYMGHVQSLIGKCDYILVPRIANYGKNDDVCVKLLALYDIVKNTFGDIKLLDYNIDVKNGKRELAGFLKIGKRLGKSCFKTLCAYRSARLAQEKFERERHIFQHTELESADGLKILVVSHPYNTYDNFIGRPVTAHIKALGGRPIFADALDRSECLSKSTEMSETLHWRYNRELIGSIKLLEGRVGGIVLLTAFPCGPDSLVNELLIRKIKNVPVVNIVLDELQGEAGLLTRIESFMDILKIRAKKDALFHAEDNQLSAYGQLRGAD
jgi:predicted nucleotide-binding protein (sugar kinase/HSP70/actin superfamily)